MKLGGSILSDIDDQLEFGDIIVINNNINSEQSRLRKIFDVPFNNCKTPFEFSKDENRQSSLKINPHSSNYYTVVINKEIMQNVNDDICENVDCIDINGHITISTDDIGKNIAKKIIGGQLNIKSNVISNVELSATSCTTPKLIPIIYINFNDEECDRHIHNTTFEIDGTKCPGWLAFRNDIPKFDNVRSKTVKILHISDNLLNKSYIIENEFWSKLFEFGYKAEYTFEGVTNTKKILGMKSFSGIFKDHNFRSLEFSEFPYRLKKGVKLNDILDVSQFENLHAIDIECKNIGVYIYKKELEPRKIEAFINGMMKPNYDDSEIIERNLPCTEDGWSVILYRL